MRAGEHPPQVVGLHSTGEPEPRGSGALPSAGRLACVGVVRRRVAGGVDEPVDALVLKLEKVVLLADGELGDREHTM